MLEESENKISTQKEEHQTPPLQTGKITSRLPSNKCTACEIVLLLVGCLFQFLQAPTNISGDGYIRFQALTDLLAYGHLSAAKYSLIGPLFSAPFWLLGKVVLTPEIVTSRYNLFLFIGGLAAFYWLLRNQLEHSLLRQFFLILLVGSMFTNQLPTYNAEVFTAVGVGVGVLAAVVRTSLPAWVVIVLGVANAPASVAGLACVVAKHVLDSKKWRYTLALFAALALIAGEAWLRRGSPLTSGYEGDKGNQTVMPYSGLPGFSYPLFFGILSILFSFGKGLVFFAPGLLLPIKSRLLSLGQEAAQHLYNVYLLWGAFLIGLVLIYAKWWAWYGGWTWGPRFFLFASIPASFALAVRLHRLDGSLPANLLTAAALTLSFWVGIDGATFGKQGLETCTQNQYALEFLCHYVPEFSVLWRPFVVPEQLEWGQLLYIAYSALVFVYLALPLLRVIASQSLAQATRLSKLYLKPGAWHF
ncbi:MAG TPA: hypothetical protein VH540_01495 [Ktedonobacterales bacterium]